MRGKFTSLVLTLVLFMSLILASCAPKAAPAPSPATPAPIPVAPATPTVQAITPEEAAWAKVLAEAKKEGKVTLYTVAFIGDVGRSVAKAFEDKYGIKLEFVTGIGNVLIERIKGEHAAKKYLADTLDTALSIVLMAKQDGLTERVGELPVLRERDVWTVRHPLVDPEGHMVSLRSASISSFVNTTLVRPGEEPKSLLELLEPKWKGKVAFGSPVTAVATVWLYLALRKAGLLDDEYWRRLAKNEPKIGPSNREPVAWLSRGEAHVTLTTADTTVAPLIKEGAPVKAVDSEEGILVAAASTALAPLRNAPHPNAVRVFINWILSQEGQTVFAQAMGGFAPLRKDVADVRPAALRLTPKKVHLVDDLAFQLEATRVQREGTVAKLLGLEK